MLDRKGEKRERERLSKVGGIIRPFLKSGKKWLGVDSPVEAESESFFRRARRFFFRGNGVKSGDCVSRSHCRGLDFATIISGAGVARSSASPQIRGVTRRVRLLLSAGALSYLERARLLLNFLVGYFSGAFNARFIHVTHKRKSLDIIPM